MSMASSGREFDPRTRTFSDEELKPQPMVKKSRKQVSNKVNRIVVTVFFFSIKNKPPDTMFFFFNTIIF